MHLVDLLLLTNLAGDPQVLLTELLTFLCDDSSYVHNVPRGSELTHREWIHYSFGSAFESPLAFNAVACFLLNQDEFLPEFVMKLFLFSPDQSTLSGCWLAFLWLILVLEVTGDPIPVHDGLLDHIQLQGLSLLV